jgi:CMP-N,N'-diacetyllegionaminic acid synthase
MIYGLVPARSGSKGVSNKNIHPLSGKPMLLYSIETSIQSQHIDKTIISTDSQDYIDIVKQYCNQVISVKRDELTANDKATDIDYLLHAIFTIGMKADDIIVLLRPTTPTRKVEVVDSAIRLFNKGERFGLEDFDSLRSIHPLSEAPEKMFRMYEDGTLRPLIGDDIEITNQPRQTFEEAYHPNGYVDIVRVDVIMKTKKAYGIRILGYETERVQEVDTVDDLKFLELQMKGEN